MTPPSDPSGLTRRERLEQMARKRAAPRVGSATPTPPARVAPRVAARVDSEPASSSAAPRVTAQAKVAAPARPARATARARTLPSPAKANRGAATPTPVKQDAPPVVRRTNRNPQRAIPPGVPTKPPLSQRAQRLADAEASPKSKGRATRADRLPPTRPVDAPQGTVTPIPDPPAGHRIVELQPLVPERAWVRILENETEHTFLYEVIEPPLGQDEREVVEFLRDTLVRTLDGRKGRDADWETVLVEAVRQAVKDHGIKMGEPSLRRIEYHLVRDFLGYNAIDVLMRDPQIEDISCDGPNIPIYLFHRKYESLKTNVAFSDEFELDSFVIRLAQRSRKHISVADPLLDATLPDGSRLQASLSREVTTRGSSFTIRKFRADPMTPPDLIRYGTMSAEMAGWFWFAMEMGASFLLAGGTASGKTTSLNAISQFIPPEKKIVSIEDTREINLSHENWIAGVTRSGFGGELRGGKQAGSIDMYKLLESALRQRPEYLLVGEVRGPEALTLFQAMATGHAVYSTMHADSVPSAVYRLENAPINVPRMMLQTLDIVAIQAQVRMGERMTRRIREVTEIVGFEPDTKELLTNTVFEWDNVSDEHRYLGKSYVLEQVMEGRNMTEEQVELEWRNRVEVLEWMGRSNIRKVTDVARVVSGYYRDSAKFLARMRAGANTPSGAAAAIDAVAPVDQDDKPVR
ncbi:MAG: ATPase, T2SS/T4P/T4SS family [Candidatus Thermoplasmatota archaeon]